MPRSRWLRLAILATRQPQKLILNLLLHLQLIICLLCRCLLHLRSLNRPTTIIVKTHRSTAQTRALGTTRVWLATRPRAQVGILTRAQRLAHKARLKVPLVSCRPQAYKPSWLLLVLTQEDITARDERKKPQYESPGNFCFYSASVCFCSPLLVNRTRSLPPSHSPSPLIISYHYVYLHAQHVRYSLSFRLAIFLCTS